MCNDCPDVRNVTGQRWSSVALCLTWPTLHLNGRLWTKSRKLKTHAVPLHWCSSLGLSLMFPHPSTRKGRKTQYGRSGQRSPWPFSLSAAGPWWGHTTDQTPAKAASEVHIGCWLTSAGLFLVCTLKPKWKMETIPRLVSKHCKWQWSTAALSQLYLKKETARKKGDVQYARASLEVFPGECYYCEGDECHKIRAPETSSL